MLELTGVDFALLHPILRSRVFSVLRMTEYPLDLDGLWSFVHGGRTPEGPVAISAVHEIQFIAILCGDLELIDWLLDGVEIQTNRLQHHEYHDLQLYRLVEAVQILLSGRKSQCRSALEKVDLQLVNLSMKEMVSLLYQVVFLCSGRNRPEHWARYDSLAAKVGVSIFDRSFVEQYTQKD